MLNNLNSIILEGNLVRDPQLKTTPNGHDVCSFAVASNRFYRQNDATEKEVSYFDIETWARLAQTCGANLQKGRGVRVVGRLKQDRWQDSAGKTLSRVKIVAEHVEFKPQFRKEEGDGSNEAQETEAAGQELPSEAETVF